ncbi:DUF4349 domain-containing protein [Lysobacter sp. TAF61]|uniref:DUF4349 domain-containing protein n=1 Tax=Lysobacter sp. TAF61 TaxID=3233072 RepID=UPI003F99CBE4
MARNGMRLGVLLPALLAMLVALVACSEKRDAMDAGGSASARPTANRAGSMLAYEHDVSIWLAAEQIPQRLKTVQDACNSQRLGDCTVLDVDQQAGDSPNASLTVRVAPAGVEPLVAMAGKDGEVGHRRTHAEDLAVAVRDNDLQRQRLQNERSQLQAFQQRRDLAVADMIALSRQLADVDAQLQAAEQEGAQHRMRIDTQKLTISFFPPSSQSGRGEIGQALRDFGQTLAVGTAWTIRAAAFLIPLAVVLLIAAWAWRRLRRRGGY